MKTGFLITGLILLLIANLMMVYSHQYIEGKNYANSTFDPFNYYLDKILIDNINFVDIIS